MIIGTGIDLVDLRRLRGIMARYGARFQARYFTQGEIDTALSRANIGGSAGEEAMMMAFAKRWAAKEACAKALGTGFVEGVYMKDIEVVNDARGKPSLTLRGGAQARLQEMLQEGARAIVHLSLSDEPPYAQAQVIIEQL